MEDNYIPYGPEWEKEMMKLPKKFLIGVIKKAQIRLHLAKKFIDESPCDPDIPREAKNSICRMAGSEILKAGEDKGLD